MGRAEKLSISMPHKLAAAARKRAGQRGLSSFLAKAVARELEHEAFGQFLNELDDLLGPGARSRTEAGKAAVAEALSPLQEGR